MRKLLTIAGTVITAGILLLEGAGAQQNPSATTHPSPAPKSSSAASSSVLATPKEKSSYALGMNIGRGLVHQSIDVDTASLLRGLKDTLSGSKPLLSDEEAQAALSQLQNEVQAKEQMAMQKAGEENMKEGEAFLAENKTKEGVVVLPSGLQYKILTQGTGPKATASDTVVCNYRGTLINGTEFDSSYKRGQPASFAVNQVIRGWTEALQLMPVGSKWQLFIPPDLAYGPRGAGGVIGPNSTLIFEVELISIKGK
jgi:FKBP-type peptidyl-prolyl cis-trans isomerase FklB